MYEILDLMQGARNCVQGFANVQPGEEVLIVADTTGIADPEVLEALGIACREVGAKVSMIHVEDFEPRVDPPPKTLEHAIYGCSKLLWACRHEVILHSRTGMRAMYDYGVSIIPVVANRREIMNSDWARFPMEVFWAIARKVFATVRNGKTIHVKGENGTDLWAGLHPAHIVGLPVLIDPQPPLKGACNHGMFPPGCCGLHPEGDVYGVVVYDLLLGFEGVLKEPLRLTVEGHRFTQVQGGPEAAWLKQMMDKKINGNWVAEIMWGLNPKASLRRGISEVQYREGEVTRRAGTLHVGIGNGIVLGGRVFSDWHWDGVLITPFDVYIDSEPLIKNGRLLTLDDPEIVSLASKYGNPEELLKEAP
ncbi:MAG: hypothetical protein M1358_19515 [Chloroflexi bacterium]|nr:hypothetical protein [Chloroflexota bacterium]